MQQACVKIDVIADVLPGLILDANTHLVALSGKVQWSARSKMITKRLLYLLLVFSFIQMPAKHFLPKYLDS